MIISEKTEELDGMSIEDGLAHDYRNQDGSLTMRYLMGIDKNCSERAFEFKLALNKFFFNFPMQGKYKISWKIESI